MDDRSNTIAGWVLGAGIVALGASILSAEMFHGERPEKMGYPIEGVVNPDDEVAAAEQPIAAFMTAADPAAGAQVFKKCVACHTIEKGGAGGTGPNLWGTMGAPLAHVAGFNYSSALKEKGGNWTWEAMDAWIKSPRDFASGTRMSFPGIGKIEERANLLAYLNQQGDSPLPLPAPPAAAGNPAQAAAEAADMGAVGDKAPDVPIANEADPAAGATAVKGEAAPGDQ